MIKIFLFLFLITRFVPADIAVPEESRIDLKLTAYRDFGMITDKRKVQLPKGISRIRFVGVAEIAPGILASRGSDASAIKSA